MRQPSIKPKSTLFLYFGKNDTWRDMDDVRRAFAGKPVKITGTTLDLMGCQISGSKLPKPKNDQDENSAPLRINIEGFTLKRGSIRAIPGGIVFRKPNVSFYDLFFLDTGEDALSNVVDDSPGATVKGCRGWGATDKTWQFNDARDLSFCNNETYGGITGIRVQKKATKHKDIRTREAKGNLFSGTETAWHLSGGVFVMASGNDYENVRTRWYTGSGSKYKET